jgi:hypothetical protein
LRSTREFAGAGEYLHTATAVIGPPKPATMQEILRSTFRENPNGQNAYVNAVIFHAILAESFHDI